MIKVLYDHEIFTDYNRGGVSRYFRELAKRMPKWGVSVVAFGGLHISDACKEIPHFIGIRIPPFPRTRRARMFVSGLVQHAAVACVRPQVIHKTYYARDVYPRGVPVIITVHDMAHERGYNHNDSTVQKKAYWIERAATIITPSEFTRMELINMTNVDPAKIICIPHGADALPAVQSEPALSVPYFLYVGYRHAYKDFPVLLRAFAKGRVARDYRLVCCGGGRFSAKEDALIASLKLTNRIDRFDPDDTHLSILYQQARCLVYSSRYEGFGLPMVEAMRLGCPVIAADTPVSKEVTSNAAIFFAPGDDENLQEALDVMGYDDARRSDLSTQGRRAVKQMTWDLSAKRHARVYECAVTQGVAARARLA
jgi:glycosyltransferase involved in cell wall biosynthesis